MKKIFAITTILGCILLCGCEKNSTSAQENPTTDTNLQISASKSIIASVPSESDQTGVETATDTKVEEASPDETSMNEAEFSYVKASIRGVSYEIPSEWKNWDNSDLTISATGYDPSCGKDTGKYYVEVSVYKSDDLVSGAKPEDLMDIIANDIGSAEGTRNYKYSKDQIDGIYYSKIECITPMDDSPVYAMIFMESVNDDSIAAVQYTIDGGYEDTYDNDVNRIIASINTSGSADADFLPEDNSSDTLETSGYKVEATASVNNQRLITTSAYGHNYYKGLSKNQAAQADLVAKSIADSIMTNPAYTTDLQRVTAAAQTVAGYISNEMYGMDTAKYYRSPYGVFIAGVYTCAGTTRALGRVLDFMGYSWQHTNENQNRHQWCIVTMDGQTGYADGMAGIAGYGVMTNGMTLPDGQQIFFSL